MFLLKHNNEMGHMRRITITHVKICLMKSDDATTLANPPSAIEKLTDSMSPRNFDVIKLHRGLVGK